MKKFLVLFLSLAFLTACDNDDDNEQTGPDPIIGTWVLVNATGQFEGEFCLDDVTTESTITFNANNTGNATFYLTATDCAPSSSTGGWTNNGNSLYTLAVPVVGDTQGSVNFVNANRFTFTTVAGVLTFEK
ncbi:MAG TPA: lipocalin family protein [Gillisia sp.]|nr:lipocalin family protein [Gillisia sp.]